MPSVSDSLPEYRPVTWVTIGYFLGSVERIGRALDEDLGPTIAFLGIIWGNVEQANDATDETPRRRPVSVYRLAKVLRLPYESTRRYVSRLLAAGLCERVGRGLVVPDEVRRRPVFDTLVNETWQATQDMRRAFDALGVELPPAAHTPTESDRRWVTRLSAAFFLKSLGLVMEALQCDPLTAVIYLAVYDGNAAPVWADPSILTHEPGVGAPRPNEMRRPTTVYKVAKRLRLPYETTRRHVMRLIEGGWCQRVGDEGLIVPSEALTRPEVAPAWSESWKAAVTFLRQAAEHGVGPTA